MSFSNLAGKGESKPREKIVPKERVDKLKLKKELRILISCSGSGHKEYLKFKEYGIRNAHQLKARIDELIELISK